jgi:hypothetical protein
MANPTRTDPVGPSHVRGGLQLGLGLLALLVGAALLVQVWLPLLFFPVALLIELWIGGMAVVLGLLAAWFAAAAVGAGLGYYDRV